MAIKITDDLYHIGDIHQNKGLNCNPYLLIDNAIGVLIDPGSILDFDIVYQNIIDLISIENIKYVILHHEDPDICGAVPLFESKGLKAEIITSWRNMTMIQYYGVRSTYYLFEEHKNQLILPSGKKLEFIPTPYLHFAGSFATYDPDLKALFSSDLFGAFSYNITLFADEAYSEKMKMFHEHYMPSNQILRPVMTLLETFDIKIILPQHGSIINKDVFKYIKILKELECGSLMYPIKEALMTSGGYLTLYNNILDRLLSIYPREEVYSFFKSCDCFHFNDTHHIAGYKEKAEEIWFLLFDKMVNQQKFDWLLMIEPHVKHMVYHYALKEPPAIKNLLTTVNEENKRLSSHNRDLENTIRIVNERLIKCPITGLYNESFFRTLLLEELENEDWRDIGSYVCIDIDNFSKYKLMHGTDEGNHALNALTYQIAEFFNKKMIFKMDYCDLGIYVKDLQKTELIKLLDDLRTTITKSDAYLSPMTVSIGVIFPSELKLDAPAYDIVIDHYLKKGYDKMRMAKYQGGNIVSFEGDLNMESRQNKKVLIVDRDDTNIDIIDSFLRESDILTLKSHDGIEAFELAVSEIPDLIVSEVTLPRLDGFLFCEKLKENSMTKNIPVIFLSYNKDEPSVARAQSLGVSFYFKKPYLLTELIGIIKKYL